MMQGIHERRGKLPWLSAISLFAGAVPFAFFSLSDPIQATGDQVSGKSGRHEVTNYTLRIENSRPWGITVNIVETCRSPHTTVFLQPFQSAKIVRRVESVFRAPGVYRLADKIIVSSTMGDHAEVIAEGRLQIQ